MIGFVAGGLLSGGSIGAMGYARIQALQTENAQLSGKVKSMAVRQKKLSQTQSDLEAQLNGIKEKQGQGYDQTIDALMQAKETSDIDALYEIGLKAMQEKDYPHAYFSLAQVVKTDPEFKDIAKRFPAVAKAYADYQRKLADETLAKTYALARDFQIKGQLAQAQVNFQRVVELNPTYKDARSRLASVSQSLAVVQRTQDFAQKKQWLEASYSLGVNKQVLGRLAEAKETYEAIVQYAPRYRDVASRLRTITAMLPKPAPMAGAGNCYAQGLTMGSCAKSPTSPGCAQLDMSHTPAECRGNPDFQKGLASAMGRSSSPRASQGSQQPDIPDLRPDVNPDDAPDSDQQNTLSLIKNFPQFLGKL